MNFFAVVTLVLFLTPFQWNKATAIDKAPAKPAAAAGSQKKLEPKQQELPKTTPSSDKLLVQKPSATPVKRALFDPKLKLLKIENPSALSKGDLDFLDALFGLKEEDFCEWNSFVITKEADFPQAMNKAGVQSAGNLPYVETSHENFPGPQQLNCRQGAGSQNPPRQLPPDFASSPNAGKLHNFVVGRGCQGGGLGASSGKKGDQLSIGDVKQMQGTGQCNNTSSTPAARSGAPGGNPSNKGPQQMQNTMCGNTGGSPKAFQADPKRMSGSNSSTFDFNKPEYPHTSEVVDTTLSDSGYTRDDARASSEYTDAEGKVHEGMIWEVWSGPGGEGKVIVVRDNTGENAAVIGSVSETTKPAAQPEAKPEAKPEAPKEKVEEPKEEEKPKVDAGSGEAPYCAGDYDGCGGQAHSQQDTAMKEKTRAGALGNRTTPKEGGSIRLGCDGMLDAQAMADKKRKTQINCAPDDLKCMNDEARKNYQDGGFRGPDGRVVDPGRDKP